MNDNFLFVCGFQLFAYEILHAFLSSAVVLFNVNVSEKFFQEYPSV